jgi:tRNA G18 (ribose-2'-O)-methylase SpoU
MNRERTISVRCPNPKCAIDIEAATDRLGRNDPCPACGQVITIVPIAVRNQATAERSSSPDDVVRRTMPVALVLENVRSLWNVGSIFRSADGAGAAEVWLCGYTGRPPRDEISKTALGSEKVVPWREAATATDAIHSLRDQGFRIVGLERTAQSAELAEATVALPCALLVGNEVAGLTEETLSLCDEIRHLPMHGLKSSLNVAVAAGIALYELRRQAERDGTAEKDTSPR